MRFSQAELDGMIVDAQTSVSQLVSDFDNGFFRPSTRPSLNDFAELQEPGDDLLSFFEGDFDDVLQEETQERNGQDLPGILPSQGDRPGGMALPPAGIGPVPPPDLRDGGF